MSKSKTYTYPKSGLKITVEKSVYYETAGKKDPEKKTRRYMLVGKDSEGKVKYVIASKETAEKYGKPTKHIKSESAKARGKKKSCEEKFDECKAKRSAKKAAKKSSKKSPKKSKEESESEEEDVSSDESSSSSEEVKKSKGKKSKK